MQHTYTKYDIKRLQDERSDLQTENEQLKKENDNYKWRLEVIANDGFCREICRETARQSLKGKS